MPMSKEAAKAELYRRSMILNEASTRLLSERRAACGLDQPDHRRDLDEECGYPKVLIHSDFFALHDREGVAARVNSIYPDECWAVDPIVYENERKRDTPFEKKWKKLLKSDSANPLHYAHRADLLSGIGRFGILLIGTDDGAKDMSKPVPGIGEDGQPTPRGRDLNLLYLRAFSEASVQVAEFQDDDSNPRYGHPLLYNVNFADMKYENGPSETGGTKMETVSKTVHWSRVIHFADNRMESEVYGVERARGVYNKLVDVHKILGSSAEMLYKGGFPGVSIEIDPRVLEAMPIEINEESVQAEMYKYMNGLQRYLLLIGMNAKPLTAQVADPTGHLIAQMNSIAMSIGVPLRIFMGSEQAQLASGQDVRTWNRRLRKRQVRYLSPFVLRPMIDRFVALGILPKPKDDYEVFWPDVNMPDEDQLSQIADRRAASMMKFLMSNGPKMMQPSDFYRFVWGLSLPEVEEIMTNMTGKPPELEIPDMTPPAGPADSGTKGGSPSKPTKGGEV